MGPSRKQAKNSYSNSELMNEFPNIIKKQEKNTEEKYIFMYLGCPVIKIPDRFSAPI